jgi:hypothetical protein
MDSARTSLASGARAVARSDARPSRMAPAQGTTASREMARRGRHAAGADGALDATPPAPATPAQQPVHASSTGEARQVALHKELSGGSHMRHSTRRVLQAAKHAPSMLAASGGESVGGGGGSRKGAQRTINATHAQVISPAAWDAGSRQLPFQELFEWHMKARMCTLAAMLSRRFELAACNAMSVLLVRNRKSEVPLARLWRLHVGSSD